MNQTIIEEMKRRIDALADDEFEIVKNYIAQKSENKRIRQANNQMVGDILKAMFAVSGR